MSKDRRQRFIIRRLVSSGFERDQAEQIYTLSEEIKAIDQHEREEIRKADERGDHEEVARLQASRGDATMYQEREVDQLYSDLLRDQAALHGVLVERADYEDDPYFKRLTMDALRRIRVEIALRRESISLRRWTILGVVAAIVSTLDATVAVRHDIHVMWLWQHR
jgi:hypothetical protein